MTNRSAIPSSFDLALPYHIHHFASEEVAAAWANDMYHLGYKVISMVADNDYCTIMVGRKDLT